MLVATQRDLASAAVNDMPEVLLPDAGYWHSEQMQRITADAVDSCVARRATAPAAARQSGFAPAAGSRSGMTGIVDDAALLELVTEAVARAANHESPLDWDREVAQVAIRRWRSFGRRHKAGGYEARVRDVARGLVERLDPERMDEPGWHVWTAEAAGEVLRQHLA